MKNGKHANFTASRSPRAIAGAVLAWGIAVDPAWPAAGQAPLETATAMAPLEIPRQIGMARFEQLLDEAKRAGADSVSVDVWWGMVEKRGDQQFDWSYSVPNRCVGPIPSWRDSRLVRAIHKSGRGAILGVPPASLQFYTVAYCTLSHPDRFNPGRAG